MGRLPASASEEMKRRKSKYSALIFIGFLPASLFRFGFSFVHPTLIVHRAKDNGRLRTTACLFSSDGSHSPNAIDRQSDEKYGRGLSHISADLKEEDVIAYQSGTWYVDGTEVGKGNVISICEPFTLHFHVWTGKVAFTQAIMTPVIVAM